MNPDERHREAVLLGRDVRNYLNYMAELGVERLPEVERPRIESHDPSYAAPQGVRETLEDIRRDLGDCTRCPLHQGRHAIVFGEGPPEAGIMFIGEGPGADEDRQGRPFVGRAGQLLTDIIVKGMKWRREDCYIANIVKCRPPQNRDPEPEEARTCLPFLMRQIEAIRPRVIVALGRVATQYLLDIDAPLGRLRHHFHNLGGISVMPTYHPSYLLRSPDKKREAWEDIKLVMAKLSGA